MPAAKLDWPLTVRAVSVPSMDRIPPLGVMLFSDALVKLLGSAVADALSFSVSSSLMAPCTVVAAMLPAGVLLMALAAWAAVVSAMWSSMACCASPDSPSSKFSSSMKLV